MNLEKLKEAVNKREKLAPKVHKTILYEMIIKFEYEKDYILRILEQIRKKVDYEVGEHGMFSILVKFSKNSRYDTLSDVLLENDNFKYVRDGDRITRVCRYESVAVYDQTDNICISNTVVINDTSVSLTKDIIDILDNPYDKDLIGMPSLAFRDRFYAKRSDIITYLTDGKTSNRLFDNKQVIAKNVDVLLTENYDTLFYKINLFTKTNKEGLTIAVNKLLTDATEGIINDLNNKYTEHILDTVENTDFDPLIEDFLYKVMTSGHYKEKKHLTINFRLSVNKDNRPYQYKITDDAITVVILGDSVSLVATIDQTNDRLLDIPKIKLPEILLPTELKGCKEISDIVDKFDLKISEEHLTGIACYNYSFYEKLSDAIAQKLRKTGLTLKWNTARMNDIHPHVVILIENPVYSEN